MLLLLLRRGSNKMGKECLCPEAQNEKPEVLQVVDKTMNCFFDPKEENGSLYEKKYLTTGTVSGS